MGNLEIWEESAEWLSQSVAEQNVAQRGAVPERPWLRSTACRYACPLLYA